MVSKVISSTVVYIAGSGFTQLISLFFTLVLMQELALEEYGSYSVIIAFVAIFSFIIDGGLTGYIIKEFNNKKYELSIYSKQRNIFITNVFLYQFVVTILLLITYFFAVSVIVDDVQKTNYFAFGVTTLVLGLSAPAFALLVANQKRTIVVVKDIVTALLRLVFLVSGLKFGLDPDFVYYIPVTAFFVSTFAALYAFRRMVVGFQLEFGNVISDFSTVFISVFPFLVLALVNILYNKIDFLMLNELSTLTEVAYYSGATIFVYPFMFVCAAASSAILPFFSRQTGSIQDEKLIFKFMFLLGLLLSLSLFLLSDYFYSNLFDGKYALSSGVYQILVWYLLVVFCYTSMSNLLVARGKLKLLIYMNCVMLAFNVAMNYVMIPHYGARGAAFATVLSEIIILVFLWFTTYGKRRRDA